MLNNEFILLGYSGHSYVCIDVALQTDWKIKGYVTTKESLSNPYHLTYLGNEKDQSVSKQIQASNYFIAIGDNKIRQEVAFNLGLKNLINLIHPKSIVSKFVELGNGCLVNAAAVINPNTKIGEGVICNTASVIEHDCFVSDFTHIGPGAVVCGNVTIGECSFIGANAVIKNNIKIGKNCTIGAGSVVINDVADGEIVVGNPARKIKVKS